VSGSRKSVADQNQHPSWLFFSRQYCYIHITLPITSIFGVRHRIKLLQHNKALQLPSAHSNCNRHQNPSFSCLQCRICKCLHLGQLWAELMYLGSFCSNNDGWQLRHSSPVLCQSLQANDVPDFQPETWGRYYRIASNILKSICLGQRLLTYNLLESIFPVVSAGLSMLLCLYKIIGCVLVLCQCQQPVPSLCISSLLSVCQKVSVLMLTAGFLAQVAQLLMCFLCRHLPHSAAVQAGWKHLFLCLCDSGWSAWCWWLSALLTLCCFPNCWILVAEHTYNWAVSYYPQFLPFSACISLPFVALLILRLSQDIEVWVLFLSRS